MNNSGKRKKSFIIFFAVENVSKISIIFISFRSVDVWSRKKANEEKKVMGKLSFRIEWKYFMRLKIHKNPKSLSNFFPWMFEKKNWEKNCEMKSDPFFLSCFSIVGFHSYFCLRYHFHKKIDFLLVNFDWFFPFFHFQFSISECLIWFNYQLFNRLVMFIHSLVRPSDGWGCPYIM